MYKSSRQGLVAVSQIFDTWVQIKGFHQNIYPSDSKVNVVKALFTNNQIFALVPYNYTNKIKVTFLLL